MRRQLQIVGRRLVQIRRELFRLSVNGCGWCGGLMLPGQGVRRTGMSRTKSTRQIRRSALRSATRRAEPGSGPVGDQSERRISGQRAACGVGVITMVIAAWASTSDVFQSVPPASAVTATEKRSPETAGHPEPVNGTAGMVWVPGGEFMMGSDDDLSRLNERPAHRASVNGFWIDATPVTNAEFAKFVQATGYLTTAEQTPDWEELKQQLPAGTPRPDDSVLVPGSMVFRPSEGPVDLRNMANFWHWVPGASWRQPEGPESDLRGREHHPVVQVSWDDAVAYAEWAGKSLPTEAQWEFAARGGLQEKRYVWGDSFCPDGTSMANIWDGNFPWLNTQQDGFAGTSPVKSFPANGYGLYDMAGNVWNWCADRYRFDAFQHRQSERTCCATAGQQNCSGPAESDLPERVVKGGSYLCHPDYCASYRPSARRGLPADTGMSHVGFRCVINAHPASLGDALP